MQVWVSGYHKSMHTFRYNPVFEQWVVLGSPIISHPINLKQFIDVGETKHFVAANYPRHPFLLDPNDVEKTKQELVYSSRPAVGEYELLLYKGDEDLTQWSVSLWEEWLGLLQTRLMQAHHNPHLSAAKFVLYTRSQTTVNDGMMRVGDLVITSHPIAGSTPVLSEELAHKILKKERIFTLLEGEFGSIQIPSAPLYEKELWLIPKHFKSGVERIDKKEKQDLAEVLMQTFKLLSLEFEESYFVLQIHTSFTEPDEPSTWWLQIYQEPSDMQSALTTRAFPENLVAKLKKVLR